MSLEDIWTISFSLFHKPTYLHSRLRLVFPGSLRVIATTAKIKRVVIPYFFLNTQIPVMKACEITFHNTNCQKDKRSVTSAGAVIRSCHGNLCGMGNN